MLREREKEEKKPMVVGKEESGKKELEVQGRRERKERKEGKEGRRRGGGGKIVMGYDL